MTRSALKLSAAHLDLADDEYGRVAVVGQHLLDAEVCLAQARPRAVPAHDVLSRCVLGPGAGAAQCSRSR
jgi:hypothetical protein